MRTIPWFRCLLFALVVLTMSAPLSAQVGIAITFGPPPLPVYEQPFCPGEGYIWVPGYWAFDYDFDDYYWVPGTWVLAPRVGFFWTPGYWAWAGNRFIFYEGYWGPRVGFYGGINYGYGYFGNGYEGGRWDHGRFFYNRSVNNINVTNIRNVYNTTVINNVTVNRISYNGGNGGINARPTRDEERAARERHIPPVAAQAEHVRAARDDRELRASVNHGKPAIAASPRPGDFRDRVPAKEAGGPYTPPANRAEGGQRGNRPEAWRRPGNAVHPNDLPRGERPAPPSTGDTRRDQKYQRDQEKLIEKQGRERQQLQQRQEQDHQRMERQRADDRRQHQIEQQHQQQTQKLEQKHERQQQQMQEKHQPANRDRSKPPKEDRPPNER